MKTPFKAEEKGPKWMGIHIWPGCNSAMFNYVYREEFFNFVEPSLDLA